MRQPRHYERPNSNPKRRICRPNDLPDLDDLAARVRYEGHPFHKRNPGDFEVGAQPRGDKTLCDAVEIFRHATALRLLRAGVRCGLISVQTRGGFPQNIWAVSDDGRPLEAQQGSPGHGIYHGYPLLQRDELWEKVLDRWIEQ